MPPRHVSGLYGQNTASGLCSFLRGRCRASAVHLWRGRGGAWGRVAGRERIPPRGVPSVGAVGRVAAFCGLWRPFPVWRRLRAFCGAYSVQAGKDWTRARRLHPVGLLPTA